LCDKPESNGFEVQNPNPTDSDFSWLHQIPNNWHKFFYRPDAFPVSALILSPNNSINALTGTQSTDQVMTGKITLDS